MSSYSAFEKHTKLSNKIIHNHTIEIHRSQNISRYQLSSGVLTCFSSLLSTIFTSVATKLFTSSSLPFAAAK